MKHDKPVLEEFHFESAAKYLGCEVAAIKAVAEVESPRGGFNPDDTPVTLFEGHWFSRYTKGKFNAEFPSISYPKWTKQFYGKNWKEEQARIQQAIALDRTSALMSASWGKFQIMGFNFAVCGFRTIQQFVNAMYKSEEEHLNAFCNYIVRNGLDDEFRDLRWDDFAYQYNGPEYKKNRYAEKLETAYKKYKGV